MTALLAVWDVKDWHTVDKPFPLEASIWVKDHIGRHEDTYRIEFCMLDGPFARVFRFSRNADGAIYLDNDKGGPVLDDVVTVPLAELPSDELLKLASSP